MDQPEEILCATCLNRDYPGTYMITPGQNIKCRKGFDVNKRSGYPIGLWVFQSQSKNCPDYEKGGTEKQNEYWKILSGCFDDLDSKDKIVCSVVEIRSWLWKKHRLNKNDFQNMLEVLRARDSPFHYRIHLYGGTTSAYTKTNYVLVDGKKYLVMTFDTKDHEKYAKDHRG